MQESLILRAHFDGTQVVLDDPVSLEPDSKLLITVLSEHEDTESDGWLNFSASNLNAAYDDDEPEYSSDDLKVSNPLYEPR